MDSFEMIDPDAITLPYSGLRLNTLEDFEMDFGHVSTMLLYRDGALFIKVSLQALSIDPKTLLSSTESIEVCGITLTDPLTADNKRGDSRQSSRQSRCPSETEEETNIEKETSFCQGSSQSSRSSSRLAIFAKTIGRSTSLYILPSNILRHLYLYSDNSSSD